MGRKRRNLGPCGCCTEKCVGMCARSPIPVHLFLTCTFFYDQVNDAIPGVTLALDPSGLTVKMTNVSHPSYGGVADPTLVPCKGLNEDVNSQQLYEGINSITQTLDDGLGNFYDQTCTIRARSYCCGSGIDVGVECDDTPGISIQVIWDPFILGGGQRWGDAPEPLSGGIGQYVTPTCSYDTDPYVMTKTLISCNPLLAEFKFKRLRSPSSSLPMDLWFALT